MTTGPDHSLVLSFTPGIDRNNFTGEGGVRVHIGPADLVVSWMGYRCNTGNTGPRTITLYEWFTDTVVATVTVDLTGATAGDYVWVAITPATLLADGYYALMSNVTDGDGQMWPDVGAVTMVSSIAEAYAAYRISGYGLTLAYPGALYIGLDLGWVVSPPPPVTTGLVVRLDALSLDLADGDPVTAWPNLGSGADPTIYAVPPTFMTGVTPSGGPSVRESVGNFIGGVHSLTQDYTIFHVVRMWGSNTGRSFSSDVWAFLLGFHSSGQDLMYDTEGFLSAGVGYAGFPSAWKLYGADGKSAGGYLSRFFVNGVLSGTSNPAYVGTNKGMNTSYNLGGYDMFATESSDHETAELLIYDHQLTDAERISVEDYLRAKWLTEPPASPSGFKSMLAFWMGGAGLYTVPPPAPRYTKLGPGGYPIPDTSVPPLPPIIRVLDETVRAVEAKLSTVALTRAISETVHIAETKLASISVELIKIIAETVRVNEVRLGLAFAEITRIINETVRAVEVLVKGQLINRMVNETERLVEALFGVRALARMVAEAMTVHENTLGSRARNRMVGEVVNVSHVPSFIRAISLMVNELVRVVEGTLYPRALIRLLDELERVVEASIVSRSLLRLRDEFVSIVETLSRLGALFRSVDETLTVTDEDEIALGRIRMANETLTIPEVRISARRILRLRGEYVRSLETRQPVRALLRVVSDLLHLPELTKGIATIPTLVCSVIKLYAMYAGDAMLAPLVMGSVLVNPEVGGGSTSVNVEVDGVPEMEPLVDGQPEVKPLVEADVKLEECC